MTEQSPDSHRAAEYWESRYRENGRSWIGKVNVALEREVAGVNPGTALDLGSGEGGDALWLAHNGWRVTAVDISPTALSIGAAAQLPGDDITWVAADLAEWQPPTQYDLVSSCFLHSTVELPREKILRTAARAVAPGGLFITIGHAGIPPWAMKEHHNHGGNGSHGPADLPTPEVVFASIFHDNPHTHETDWTIVTSALIGRSVTLPDGTMSVIEDSVLSLRRHI